MAPWRVVPNLVAAQDLSPMEPTYGGVATDMSYDGSTGIRVPLEPAARSAVSHCGMAEVYHNGELVTDQAPVQSMLRSVTRGDDFTYMCSDCTRTLIEQLHLMLPPP